MAASGFRKKSRANTRSRRAQWKAPMPRLGRCPNPACGELKPQHVACPTCGHYKGRQALRPSKP